MLPAKAFYLIRHGQTIANISEITAGGGYDSPLTDEGKAQAEDVARVIHTLDIKPSSIIHSPMSRARDTANIINGALSLDTLEVEDLREHKVGEWEGKPWPDVMPHLRADVKPEGGENRTEFAARVKAVFDTILVEHEGPLMFVAHGGTFHSLTHMHTNYKHADFHVTNCHLHYFEPSNDHPHFPWRVWQFDIEGDQLVRKEAPFCSSQADSID